MSKYKLGDYDYQIPDHGEEALQWELARLNEEVIPSLKAELRICKEWGKLASKRITELSDCLRFVRNVGLNISKIDAVLDAD